MWQGCQRYSHPFALFLIHCFSGQPYSSLPLEPSPLPTHPFSPSSILYPPLLITFVMSHSPLPQNEGKIPCLMHGREWNEEAAMDPTGWWISEKFDGIRAFWDGSYVYSKNGKLAK